jgi:PEP-CTERM motif
VKQYARRRFRMSGKTIVSVSALIGGVLWAAAVAQASTIYSGTTTGLFSTPILSGNSIETDGSLTFQDNSTTAVISGVGTDTFNWGAGLTPPPPPFSALQFSGIDFIGKAPDEVFKLGTLTYTNGSSFVDSTAWGIALTLGVVNSNVSIDPALAQLTFFLTVNGGVDPFLDADFIGFDVLPLTFHVFEGQSATADLFGYIHGDPQVVLSGISLPPGEPGFLAPVPVPEPGTYALTLTGLGLLGFLARRKRREIAFEKNLAWAVSHRSR